MDIAVSPVAEHDLDDRAPVAAFRTALNSRPPGLINHQPNRR
jgi:hypothetical protein